MGPAEFTCCSVVILPLKTIERGEEELVIGSNQGQARSGQVRPDETMPLNVYGHVWFVDMKNWTFFEMLF